MSVHNKYTGYTLKHLLLRHMYNLPLPMLMCYMLKPYTLRLPTHWSAVLGSTDLALYCAVPYMAACVDASRTVFWDRSWVLITPMLIASWADILFQLIFSRN